MLQPKPPVVTILGHVDHGKTTLLDKIRQSNLAAREFGQITQAIGAYQTFWKGKPITFLDTPGHEAFSNLRSRGAAVADLAVLVVAADDGVMPQTKESIKIIKETGIPFLVAINKIDLPGVSPEKIKAQLAENQVFVEGYGGEIVAVPISAKTGQGVDQLLEMILLVAEMEELKGDPEGEFKGIIIESKKDSFCGPLATVLVKNGSLKVDDFLVCEGVKGKVKSMRDDQGKNLQVAQISQPVQVLGFEEVPPVGALVFRGEPSSLSSPFTKKEIKIKEELGDNQKLKVIIKADSLGSLEAIVGILPSQVQIILKDVGDICESDILLAKTFGAPIFGFNIKVSSSIAKIADNEAIEIKNYKIIYDLLEDIKNRILHLTDPMAGRKIIGKAQILAIFTIKGEKIAGAKVVEGEIVKGDKICIMRGKEIIGESTIKSMKHEKEEIEKAVLGMEFGITFNLPVDFQKEDSIISYR